MNFELVISHQLEETFSRSYGEIDYLNKKSNFISKFKAEFLVELEKLTEFNAIHFSSVAIQIRESNEKSIQASIVIEKDSPDLLSFHLYEHVYISFLEDPESFTFTSSILHELIHYLDFTILNEINDEYQLKKLKLRSLNEIHYSIEWMFIHLMSTIRNEGVALLGEKIFTKNQAILNNEIAFRELENDLNLAISLCHSSAIDRKNININELKNILFSIEKNAYNYADVVLFHFLNDAFDLNSDLISIIQSNDTELKMKLLQHAFSYDLSEWLRGLLKTELNNSVNFRINYTKLSALSQFIILDNYSTKKSIDFNQILVFAHKNDVNNFIDLIQQITEEKIHFNDLNKQIENYKQKQSCSDIEIDITHLINHLTNQRNHLNQELIDWSLSYLFNKKDLLHDDISFLGYQDDWMVLESASILLKKNPNV